MQIHREGRNTILLFIVLLCIASFLSWNFTQLTIYRILIALPFAILLMLILWFFRIPKRTCHAAANQIVAPADGKVVVIEKTYEAEYFKDDRIQISIFMSPLNVHQNVYPISGAIKYTRYHKGKYLVAWHPKSSTENERSTVVIKHNSGKEILLRQIAGAVARRICTYSKVSDVAQQGNEMGFIKFGSRVDVFLPLDAKITCSVNDIVFNKKDTLAEI